MGIAFLLATGMGGCIPKFGIIIRIIRTTLSFLLGPWSCWCALICDIYYIDMHMQHLYQDIHSKMESTWLDNGTQTQTSGQWKLAQQRNPKTSAFFFWNRQLHQAQALTDLPLFAKELETNKLVLACTAQSRFGSLKQPAKPVLSSFLALAHWNKAPEGPQGHNNMAIATSSKHDTPWKSTFWAQRWRSDSNDFPFLTKRLMF